MTDFKFSVKHASTEMPYDCVGGERVLLMTLLRHAWSRMQKFQDDPKIVYCRALLEKGANVTCVEDGLPTWVAEVLHCS